MNMSFLEFLTSMMNIARFVNTIVSISERCPSNSSSTLRRIPFGQFRFSSARNTIFSPLFPEHSALKYVSNVLDGGNYSRQEIELCFNVNNNIGTFYYDSGDFLNAHNYYKNALDIYRICPDKLSTAAVMELTLNLRELRLAVENRNMIALNEK